MLNKKIIIKILENKKITMKEYNSFLADYIFKEKEVHPTLEQLEGVKQLISMGVFDILYAAKKAASYFNLNVLTIKDSDGNYLKAHIYV